MKKTGYMKKDQTHKKPILMSLILSAVLLFSNGCGVGNSAAGENAEGVVSRQSGTEAADGFANTPGGMSDPAAAPGVSAVAQGDALFVQEYLSMSVKSPDGDYSDKMLFADSYGSKIYLICACHETADEKEGWQCSLSLFDADTRQMEQQTFSLEVPGKERYYILSMEVRGEDELSFRMQETGTENPHDFLVRTDMVGTVLAMEDSFPDGKGYPWNPSVEETRMVFDQPDGSVILWEMDDSSGMEEASLFRFDKETRGRTLLADMQGEYLSALCQAGDEMMYYVTGGRQADIRQELAEIYDIGVSTMTNYVGLLCDSEGDVLVCFLEGSSLGIIVLSDEEVQTAEEIRMAYLEPEGPRYSVRLASDYSREHADCPIKTEQNGGDKEAFRNRILMELAAGKGPEMMWVSKEDMAILAEKGALMDLKELIPADIYEQLFSFAVQDGTIDGKMVGVAPWYSLHTMAVSKEVWSGDSWTLSELLDVAESRTDWKLILAPTRYDGYSLFRNLLRGLDGTPFLDVEQGVARFDHEDFIRLLEFCHQNGGAPLRSEQEALI